MEYRILQQSQTESRLIGFVDLFLHPDLRIHCDASFHFTMQWNSGPNCGQGIQSDTKL